MDAVNKPAHYEGEIECIECIKASMSPIEFMGYLKGNVQKYVWRYRQKGGLEDLQKASIYLGWLNKEVSNEKNMDVTGSNCSGKAFE
jgi:hypothetical protein